MKPELYTKAVLTVIALLLAVIALRPVLIPQPVHAATGHTYKVDDAYVSSMQLTLDNNSREGWEFVTAWWTGGNTVQVMFKK
jgi:hypothetical protein